LTAAVIGDGGDYIVDGIFSITDYLVIMAYDDNNFQHSTFEVGTRCMNYWLNRGLPVAKAILGVPFYGHDSSKDPNSADAYVNYNTILSGGANAQLDVNGSIGYNGIITMKSKTSYAMATGGGLAIWELSGDVTGTNSLLSAINQVVVAGAGRVSSLAGVAVSYAESLQALESRGAQTVAGFDCRRPRRPWQCPPRRHRRKPRRPAVELACRMGRHGRRRAARSAASA